MKQLIPFQRRFSAWLLLLLCASLPAYCQQTQPNVKLLYTFRTSGVPTAFVEVSPGLFWGIASNATQIFSVDTGGTYNTIYVFPSNPSGVTVGGLTPALNGSAYGGVAAIGGSPFSDLYAASPNGAVTLYPYNPATQGGPIGVVQYPDNYLYSIFGSNVTLVQVFTRLDYQGKTTNLYTFSSAQGSAMLPFVGLDGDFYGLTLMNNTAQLGIYRLTSSGSFSWVVPSMPTGKYGVNFGIALMQATNGKLFGVLPQGGSANAGTIYEANWSGQYKTIYEFKNLKLGIPETLMEASDGMLYGTARGEWSYPPPAYSSVFQVNPSTGQFKTIYNFTDPLIARCECILIQATDGKIYGVDHYGGAYGLGTVFVMDLGLPKPLPHVTAIVPQAGAVEQSILLFGDGLLGATAVSFNGSPATTFTVASQRGIWATVPAGATTGPITVTTPNGSFTTKKNFTVQ